jgi:hypothetical protein
VKFLKIHFYLLLFLVVNSALAQSPFKDYGEVKRLPATALIDYTEGLFQNVSSLFGFKFDSPEFGIYSETLILINSRADELTCGDRCESIRDELRRRIVRQYNRSKYNTDQATTNTIQTNRLRSEINRMIDIEISKDAFIRHSGDLDKWAPTFRDLLWGDRETDFLEIYKEVEIRHPELISAFSEFLVKNQKWKILNYALNRYLSSPETYTANFLSQLLSKSDGYSNEFKISVNDILFIEESIKNQLDSTDLHLHFDGIRKAFSLLHEINSNHRLKYLIHHTDKDKIARRLIGRLNHSIEHARKGIPNYAKLFLVNAIRETKYKDINFFGILFPARVEYTSRLDRPLAYGFNYLKAIRDFYLDEDEAIRNGYFQITRKIFRSAVTMHSSANYDDLTTEVVLKLLVEKKFAEAILYPMSSSYRPSSAPESLPFIEKINEKKTHTKNQIELYGYSQKEAFKIVNIYDQSFHEIALEMILSKDPYLSESVLHIFHFGATHLIRIRIDFWIEAAIKYPQLENLVLRAVSLHEFERIEGMMNYDPKLYQWLKSYSLRKRSPNQYSEKSVTEYLEKYEPFNRLEASVCTPAGKGPFSIVDFCKRVLTKCGLK